MTEADFERMAEKIIKQYVLDEYAINYHAIGKKLEQLYNAAWDEGYDTAVKGRDV